MLLVQRAKFFEVRLLVKQTLTLQFLPFNFLLGQFRDSVLPILCVATENALVEDISNIIDQLEGVHSRTLETMESLIAVSALDGSTLGLTAIARELLIVYQISQRFTDVYPFLALQAELRILIILDAVLVEEKWLTDQLIGWLLLLVLDLVFAEWTNERLVSLLAETAFLLARLDI